MSNVVSPPSSHSWLDFDHSSCSLGLKVGKSVYLSGISGSNAEVGRQASVPSSLKEQARLVYTKVAAALEAAGTSIGEAVKIVEYISVGAFEQYADAEGVRNEALAGHHPAVSTVIVKRFPRPDALIAVEVSAGPSPALALGVRRAHSVAESDGVVHLLNLLPVDDKGQIIAPGDLVGQTRAIFKKAAHVLEALGLTMDHVVMTVDHFIEAARRDYKRSGTVREEFLGPIYPAAAGVGMPALAHPEALIQYSFTATREKPVRVDMGWKRYDKLTYSPAIRSGRRLFMSGLTARNPVDGIMPSLGDVLGQCEHTYAKVIKIIEAAGGTAANLVSLVENVSPASLERYAEVGEVRRRMFEKPYPVATSFACNALLRHDMEVEIIPFAILDWERK